MRQFRENHLRGSGKRRSREYQRTQYTRRFTNHYACVQVN